MKMEATQETTEAISEATAEQIEGLKALDTSLGFLLILIAAILISFIATVREREGLCCAIAGDTEKAAALSDVFPLRCKGTAMTIGASGFFLCLALREASKQSVLTNPAARYSSELNILEAALILGATLVRLKSLVEIERCGGGSIAEEVEPI